MEIKVCQREDDGRDWLARINRALNNEVARMRRTNPRGWRDEYDQRFDILLEDAVTALGGRMRIAGPDYGLVADFSGVRGDAT